MTKAKCPLCNAIYGVADSKWGEIYHGPYTVRLRATVNESQAFLYGGFACDAQLYVQAFYNDYGFEGKALRVRLENKWVGWGECFESIYPEDIAA